MDNDNTQDGAEPSPASAGYAVKWKTQRGFQTIERVEVVRETAKFLWTKEYWFKGERQSAKESDYHKFHDSWDEAWEWLLMKEAQAIDFARQTISQAEERMQKIRGMERPA